MTQAPPPWQPQPSGGQHAASEPPRKRRRWPWVVGGVLAFFVLIAVVANTGSQYPSTVTPTVPKTPAVSIVTPEPARAVTPTQAGPQTSFGDGTWVVGEDIVAGTYKTPGAAPGVTDFCAVTTHAGDTTDSPILNIASANANEPIRLKLSGNVKSVEAHGCEPFTKVG